jgi:hypothetical protein
MGWWWWSSAVSLKVVTLLDKESCFGKRETIRDLPRRKLAQCGHVPPAGYACSEKLLMESGILVINRKWDIQNEDLVDDLFKTLINAAIYADA